MSSSSGAEALIQALIDQGSEVLFGYPGGAIMPVYDALYDQRERVRHILVRHEQGAAHAAQGYARASGKVGVCLATSGPGATNLITALVDAQMDSTPLVCITGQVFSHLLGRDAFQEADVMGLSMAATKWNYQITDPAEIPGVIEQAFRIARNGRPGPVLIDISRDAQLARFDPVETAATHLHYSHWDYPNDQQDLSGIERAAALINQAGRPYLLLGQGVLIAQAEGLARQLAETAGMPTACTLLGLSAMPARHPLYVGMLGMHGSYGANRLTNEADVIVAIGMRFDDRVTGRLDDYARQAKIIHIEIDPAEVNRQVTAEVALVADAAAALRALLPHIETRRHDDWLARFRAHDAEEHEQVIAAELNPGGGAIRMAEVIDRISARTAGETLIVSDVGQHQMIAARYYRFERPYSHITSGGAGTMGFALPAAIGARLGAATRQVIAVIGDGGFQMTLQELGTVAQERLPLKIVILNNHYLGMVRQWQELFFERRYSFVDIQSPDYVTLCRAYGIDACRVDRRDDLDAALDTMLASDGPCLLDIAVAREDNVFPMIPAGASVSEVRLS
jgi:acetolactate synthase-1/2/3 large subunit